MRRVVVTGIGIVAPRGPTARTAWASAVAGETGVGRITAFDASAFPVQIAAEVSDLDLTGIMDAKTARQSSRFVQLAAVAAHEAIENSGLDTKRDSHRYGCSIGTGIGGLELIESQAVKLKERGPARVSPMLIPYSINNMAAGFTAITHRLGGPNICLTTACASGAHAIGEAYFHIAMGTADAMLAGGVEAGVTPLVVAGFASMRALSTNNDDPRHASRPFDRDRDGFVVGEGCGLLVLEEYEHAKQRDATVLAELIGYGLSGDAHHITGPPETGEGAARAMAGCLQSAGLDPGEVDYINAHGTSTPLNDVAETRAIRHVFGQHARRVPVSSTKGVTGHCLGAAGGIEAAFTVQAIHHGLAPPTANLSIPDPECDLDYIPGQARERPIRCAISNSFGFGGQNSCLAFRRLSPP